MDIKNLVSMANCIGTFFQSMPNCNEAKAEIAQHIIKFWEPRMRESLIAKIDDPSTSGLHDIVREAVKENLDLFATKKTNLRA